MTGPRTKYTEYFHGDSWPVWNNSTGHKWPSDPWSGGAAVGGTTGKDELLITSGHPYRSLGKSNRNIGGAFMVIKRNFGDLVPGIRHYSDSANPLAPNRYHYHGPVRAAGVPPSAGAGWPAPVIMSSSDMIAFGTTAISRTAPTNPVSGLLTSLVELKREGIPSVLGIESWRNRTNIARAAGNEYLNHQFGWLPLISDLKKFSHAVTHQDELLRQYERNSGKRVKRTLKIPISSSTATVVDPAYPQPALPAIWVDSTEARYKVTDYTTTQEVWFEGAFSYYLPPYKPNGDNLRRNEQLANYLYGSRPTPAVLWNLTPWSWAVDWVSNAGDVINNISLFTTDGLVLHYGYVMHKSVNTWRVSHPKIRFKSYPGEVGNVGFTASTTVKQRFPATPYGFGLDTSGFSARQWSILAALGLSRGSRQMYD